ncbi:cuticle protein 7-like [Cylas formicarius]|uniref:cuticle protein 7-like n=1 Tax=Cylas formicarius TaxID=197179 RepID=UPI00295879FC|nr:cuticle protein 7-like [Cylas formicarius]
MFSKIFAFAAIVATSIAVPVEHGATSYSSYNQNYNNVQHIQSANAFVKATPSYSVPAYSAPSYTKVALPVAPVVSYAAPVAKVVAPITKVIAPVSHYASAPVYKEEYDPAKYEFAYGIQDAHTGDFHSQQEQRDGDHVVGQYSLHEADGTVRIVKYSDDGHGFNAVVEKSGQPTEAPAVVKNLVVPIAKAVAAAPQYQYHY